MQVNYHQTKQAKMSSNNKNTYPNFYHIHGKVLNNFVNEQHSLQLGFFLEGKTNNNDTDTTKTLKAYSSTNREVEDGSSGNDNILTQESDGGTYIELTDFQESQPNGFSNEVTAYTPNNLDTNGGPKENPISNIAQGILNQALERNNTEKSDTLILQFEAKSNTIMTEVTPTSDCNTDGNFISRPDTFIQKTPIASKRTPLNDPNSIFDTYGTLYNGLVTANTLLQAKAKQNIDKAMPT